MNKGSHGIGLNICKKIAGLLGGDLYLNEEYNQGCEFILKLILKRVRYADYSVDEDYDENPMMFRVLSDKNLISNQVLIQSNN